MNEERAALYENCKVKAEKILSVINRITNENESEAHACHMEGVSQSWFRNFARKEIGKQAEPVDKKIHAAMEDWFGYPENFLKDLCGEYMPAPDHFGELYKEISEEVLQENEREILRLRYQEEMTLAQASEEVGLSRERVRQIQARAMRKLRHPRNRLALCYGSEYMDVLKDLKSAQAEYDRACMEQKNFFKKEAEKRKEDVRKQIVELTNQTNTIKENQDTATVLRSILRSTPLEELGLSVRAFNALYRHCSITGKPQTAESIADMSFDELIGVRNLGVQSRNEVCVVFMERFGIDLRAAERGF